MSSRRETLWAVPQNLEPEDRENRQNHEFVQAEKKGVFLYLLVLLYQIALCTSLLHSCNIVSIVTRVRMSSRFHSRDFHLI